VVEDEPDEITLANQGLAISDSLIVDSNRAIGVLTKLDRMDKGWMHATSF
jgi:hypothetical protein